MTLTLAGPGFDALDARIATILQSSPLITNKAIASELGVAEATVAARHRSLNERHALHVVMQRGLATVGFHQLSFAYLQVGQQPIDEVLAALTRSPTLQSVSPTLGAADICVVIGSRDNDDLRRFIDDELAQVPGVVGIEHDLCLDILRFETRLGDLAALHDRSVGTSVLDFTDEAIVLRLMDNGRESNREIARHLGLSESAVRRRLKQLEQSGQTKLTTVCNPQYFGITALALVRIAAAPSATRAVTEALSSASPLELGFIARTTGRYQFAAVVTAADDLAIQQIIDRRIRPTPGVERLDVLKFVRTVRHNFNIVKI